MKEMKFYGITSLFLCFTIISKAQEEPDREGFRVAFYNVENLFDTDDDPTISDDEFTPKGSKNWDKKRYQKKIDHLNEAMFGIGEGNPPEILGVAEVENRKVLQDLIEDPTLEKYKYDIIHFQSPDHRGIDVGMLYKGNRFTPVRNRKIPVKMEKDTAFATRDILYVKGAIQKDTIHLFFCHWPSRYGGQKQSEPKRILAAKALRKNIDSILNTDPSARIITAGDFNDEWDNTSLLDHLKAQSEISPGKDPRLINLMASLDTTEGSYRYKGDWAYLDQVIVSAVLLKEEDIHVKDFSAHIYKGEFLMQEDSRYPGKMPSRTYLGRKYNGGYSDHLPVYIDLVE